MTHGTVKWFDNKKGYGFIVDGDDREIFVHYSNVRMDGYRTLRAGEPVSFVPMDGERGPYATEVDLLSEPTATGEPEGTTTG